MINPSPSLSAIVGDFHERGVLDIDRNLKRGPGSGLKNAHQPTFENEQQFSEEQGFMLKRSLSCLADKAPHQDLPEFVHDLRSLGIECRRLAAPRPVSFSKWRQERIGNEGDSATAALARSESQQTLAPQSNSVCKASRGNFPRQALTPVRCRPDPQALRAKSVQREAASAWIGDLRAAKVNSRRLAVAYSNKGGQHRRMSRHASTKSVESLAAESCSTLRCLSSTDSTCSTIDEESFADVRSARDNVVIPKLALHLVASAGDLSSAYYEVCSDCSTAESSEASDGESCDEESSASGSWNLHPPHATTPPMTLSLCILNPAS